MLAYAVDHKRQAMIAQKIVLALVFNSEKFGSKYQKKSL
jgi:hypothetical protein